MTKYRRRPRHLHYMAWIRTLRCVCCGTNRFIEAAHVGERAAFRKGSDLETIPLCARHHQWAGGKESHHQLGKKFWSHWNLDRAKLITELQVRYAFEFPDEAKQWWRIAA